MPAKKSRRSGANGAAAGRKLARREPNTLKLAARLADAETVATRYLHISAENKETWFTTEPIDLPVLHVDFFRLPDGAIKQVTYTLVRKQRGSFGREWFPTPRSSKRKPWLFAEDRDSFGVWYRAAPANLLRQLKVTK